MASEPEPKRPRCLQKIPEDKNESKSVLCFVALHMILPNNKVAWCLFYGNKRTQQGLADKGDSSSMVTFVNMLKEVYTHDGYVVSFNISKDIFLWIRGLLSAEDYQVWDKIKKCDLHNFNLYRKVDPDCYEDWSLLRLHAEIYPDLEDNERRAESDDSCSMLVQLIGEVFYWFVSRIVEGRWGGTVDSQMKGVFRLTGSLLMKRLPGDILVDKVQARAAKLRRNGNQWDNIRPERELPRDIKYVVVDVETHDWSNNKHEVIGCVVEIAWMLFDSGGNCLESKKYLLKPYGYDSISPKATRCHGITTKCAHDLGCDASLVFNEFTSIIRQVPEDGFVIAHNMEHEWSIFLKNLNEEQRNVWQNAPKCDTNKPSLLKYLPPDAKPKDTAKMIKRGYGFNLSELHTRISTTHTYGAHSADVDVQMTWDIFEYYNQHASNKELTWEQPKLSTED